VSTEPIVITVDRDLQDLMPIFMAQRQADQAAIAAALPLRHFEALRKVGHGMAGAGTSYGFPHISDLGERIVLAARAGDVAVLDALKCEFDDYMRRLVVKYL
jgi:hypothetical protein